MLAVRPGNPRMASGASFVSDILHWRMNIPRWGRSLLSRLIIKNRDITTARPLRDSPSADHCQETGQDQKTYRQPGDRPVAALPAKDHGWHLRVGKIKPIAQSAGHRAVSR